jgi:hypothetical protein
MKLLQNHILILSKILRNQLNKKNIICFYSSTTSQVITFIGSFIVGLGDSGLNTQVDFLENQILIILFL